MWRGPKGYFISVDPDPAKGLGQRAVVEQETFSCGHCNKVVFVKPMCSPTDMGGRCHSCDTLVCAECVDRGICDPLEEKLRRAEAKDAMMRDMGIA